MCKNKVLILGDARHGKDTLAEIISNKTVLKNSSSSVAALNIFLFDILRDKYNLIYDNEYDAYEDRVNHRDKWFNEICLYNKEDPTRLVKKILEVVDIYVGLRSNIEVEKAIEENLFSHIIGINDYRKPLESHVSNTADTFKYSEVVICNSGNIDDLNKKVDKYLIPILI